MERVIFNQQNYIKEDEGYHIDSLAIKKTNTEKNCTFSVQNIYDFVNLQIQIKLNLQLKIIFSRTFTNNQKKKPIIKASTLKTEKLQHNKLKW